MEHELVLWRHQGTLRAWRDLCPHRGTRLSLGQVRDNRLVCPYHGWSFAQDGRCVLIPAHPDQPPPERACLKPYPLRIELGLVWVALGDANFPPLLDWEGHRLIPCGPYPFQAAAPRVVENFLDVAHFPFVHDGLLGDSRHPEVSDYRVETTPEGLWIEDLELYQANPDGTGQGSWVRYRYRVPRPLLAWFGKGQGFGILLGICPLSQSECLAFMVIAMNYGLEISAAELEAFQDRIVSQDRPIVESQRPEQLPLDLSEELHLRSDRAALAYRRWLGDRQVGPG